MNRDDELRKQGWTRRFVACEPRLGESVDLYRDLGYEVRLEPLEENPEADQCEEECRICFDQDRERYRIIYTRSLQKNGHDDTSESE